MIDRILLIDCKRSFLSEVEQQNDEKGVAFLLQVCQKEIRENDRYHKSD